MKAENRVIIFGGSGFLGSHVADALTVSGYDVTIFDLVTSPYLQQNQKMIMGNILDKEAVLSACKGMKYVFNFAGLADINQAKDDPERTILLNILGNQHILESAKQCGAKRFIFASSVYVYSESGSFYRISKQASERIVELYYDNYGLPFTILRYGSLYGRRADSRNSIYRFLHSALTKKMISYQGSGDELREYIHAEDAALATVKTLEQEFENKHVVLTGHQAFRVRDIMTMIAEILPGPMELNFENKHVEAHYNVTPYAYKPRVGKKLVVNPFVDMGQGVLDCIHELEELNPHFIPKDEKLEI
jgi:UDP-glucose 4-epimerase